MVRRSGGGPGYTIVVVAVVVVVVVVAGDALGCGGVAMHDLMDGLTCCVAPSDDGVLEDAERVLASSRLARRMARRVASMCIASLLHNVLAAH